MTSSRIKVLCFWVCGDSKCKYLIYVPRFIDNDAFYCRLCTENPNIYSYFSVFFVFLSNTLERKKTRKIPYFSCLQ